MSSMQVRGNSSTPRTPVQYTAPGASDIEDNDDEDDDLEEEEEEGEEKTVTPYRVAFVVAVVALFVTLVLERRLVIQMAEYKGAKGTKVEWFFNVALFGSVILLLCLPLIRSRGKAAMSAMTMLLLWLFVSVGLGGGFGAMNYRDSCTYYHAYNTNGTNGSAHYWLTNNTILNASATAFAHPECIDSVYLFYELQKASATKPEVVATMLGTCFAIFSTLAISSLGAMIAWLREVDTSTATQLISSKVMDQVEKTKFVFSLAAICANLADWQDLTLTLYDGDVMEGTQNCDGGWPCHGSYRTVYYCMFAWCGVSFLVLVCSLIYEFARAIEKIYTAPHEDTSTTTTTTMTRSDWWHVMACLIFIDLPFLVIRTYTMVHFDALPSSMILKNLVSVPKFIYELVTSEPMSNTITASVGSSNLVKE